MLDPTDRHLFTDALRPPTGFTVDVAVGTTYTLGLASLLFPPLAMAAHDRESTDGDDGADIALLEAVRRFSERMTVFCHAGAIHVPPTYRRILAFAEDAVVEVLPPETGRTFHPKIWALRFKAGDNYRHRLLVLSRNLTADTCWDTIVQLDESDSGHGIDAGPASDFLEALPGLSLRSMAQSRLEQVQSLAQSLRSVRFEVPPPFAHGELWPLGVGTGHGWPIPSGAWNSVVISPFLDKTTVERATSGKRRIFVSRPESYNELGSDVFDGAETKVLDPLAERQSQDAVTEDGQPWETRSGLHAKTFAWDYDRRGWCFTGSANATSAAFGGNVEFSMLLRAPLSRFSVQAFLPKEPPKGDAVTLARVLVDHPIDNHAPEPDPLRGPEMEAAAFHAALVAALPVLDARPGQTEGRYDVTLTFEGHVPTSPGSTTVRILSRPQQHHAQSLEDDVEWDDFDPTDLTPFIAVQTEVDVPGHGTLRVDGVMKAHLVGAPDDRAAQVLRNLLTSEVDVLRYLRFLLDDTGGDTWMLHSTGAAPGGSAAGPTHPTFDDLALLETLVRAAARGDESLSRVHALLRDLKKDDGTSALISAEFLDVWEAVWTATSEKAGEPA